jgi:hypothetical protein
MRRINSSGMRPCIYTRIFYFYIYLHRLSYMFTQHWKIHLFKKVPRSVLQCHVMCWRYPFFVLFHGTKLFRFHLIAVSYVKSVLIDFVLFLRRGRIVSHRTHPLCMCIYPVFVLLFQTFLSTSISMVLHSANQEGYLCDTKERSTS